MFREFCNYVDCINNEDLPSIEIHLTNMLEKEGFKRFSNFPDSISIDEIKSYSRKIYGLLIREVLIIGLFPGSSGWTIIKTLPREFLCRRTKNISKPRLSRLAVQTKSKAFHWSVYQDSSGILLEADEKSKIFVSGYHSLYDQSEKHLFYQEKINYNKAWQFHLINMPEDIKEAIRPDSDEEWKIKKAKLNELQKLSAQGINTIKEEAELLTGSGTIADRVLRRVVGNSSPYWKTGGSYYVVYTEEEQIKADGGRLLYFKTPQYYQQLESLSGLVPKY